MDTDTKLEVFIAKVSEWMNTTVQNRIAEVLQDYYSGVN